MRTDTGQLTMTPVMVTSQERIDFNATNINAANIRTIKARNNYKMEIIHKRS